MTKHNAFGGIFAGKTVLVTGHTGFKGSWLAIWLKLLGAKVVGYSRDPAIESKQRNFKLCRLADQITHVVGDICEAERVKNVVVQHSPEVVIHMAAQPLVNVSYQEPKRTFDTNVGGTVNICEAMRQTDCVKAFVGITTDKVYEDQKWVWGYRENDLLGGYDPYSASKAMAEVCVQSYRRSWSEKWKEQDEDKSFSRNAVSIATARAGNVIGGGDFARYRLVPDCMKALLDGKAINLRSPEAVRPWQHVLEPLGGYLWLAANLLKSDENDFSEAWNFGPAEEDAINCETMAKKVIDLWGAGTYKAAPVAPSKRHETFILKLNWIKAATYLEWQPTYNWVEALGATVDWFRDYQRQGGGSTTAPNTVDMYDFCCQQIEQYMEAAASKGIKWANP